MAFDLNYMNESILAFESDGAPRSVLLVDDHADNIDILKAILKASRRRWSAARA